MTVSSSPSPGDRRSAWRGLASELVEIRPAAYTRRVAIRAAVCIAPPMLILWSMSRLDLSVYATFGAFAALYGGALGTPTRWRTQAAVGAVLIAASVSGALVALSPHRSWIAIPLCAVWASLAAALSDRHRWRPPGPMFPVFAVATCAAIPTTPALLLSAIVTVVATAAYAVLLGVVEVWVLRRTGIARRDPAPPPPPTMPRAQRLRIQWIRCGVVVLVAGVVATASGIGHPYWAMVASVTPLAVFTLRGQVMRGVQRAVGTVVGLLVAAVLLVPPLPTLALLLIVIALFACAELLVIRNYGAAMIVVTPLAILSMHLAVADPVSVLLVDRLYETLIGAAIGIVAAIVTRDRAPAR